MSMAQSFDLQTNREGRPYYVFCSACVREGADCGSDRDKVSQEARKQGYKLVPGIGWVCTSCWWAVSFETQIQGTVEARSA